MHKEIFDFYEYIRPRKSEEFMRVEVVEGVRRVYKCSLMICFRLSNNGQALFSVHFYRKGAFPCEVKPRGGV